MDDSVVALFWCKKDNLRANHRVDSLDDFDNGYVI